MESIRKLLEKNPQLLRCKGVDADKRQRKERYGQFIKDTYNKLEDIVRQYRSWVLRIPGWRLESGERVFCFGKSVAKDYDLNLREVERLFNEILPRRLRGALLGFFISGVYDKVIQRDDILHLNLSRYSGGVSGLGYRHTRGHIEIVGSRAYWLGVKMRSGEILFRGDVGSHIGTFMAGGRLTIDGDAGNWIGYRMSGGEIRVKGNVADVIGKKMTAGEIIIEGDAGHWVADDMRGGVIRIQGVYGSIDEERLGGEVVQWQKHGRIANPQRSGTHCSE
ncbi:MAG: hypothetical protein JRJ12_02950 [Deltaproteobacteria bacterium]|nr:hypothetical protein [Deltaproteobacteria bacterium]MBW2070123.1 hypothetical protein [Deltaproteobacteria bacterium]